MGVSTNVERHGPQRARQESVRLAFLGEGIELLAGFQYVNRPGFVDLIEFAVGKDGRG